MSFAKAKRFNYKDPEIQVSPADYNISGTLEKGYSIPKCARFQEKKDETEPTFVCSRLNCSRETHSSHCCPSVSEKQEFVVGNVEEKKYSQSPRTPSNTEASPSGLLYPTSSIISNKDTYSQQVAYTETKNKPSNFERNYSIRKFSKRMSFRNSTPKIKFSDNYTRPRSSSTESSDSNREQIKRVIKSQQFIDDDYHSLTSSDECEQLRKIDEYEYQAVRKAIQEIHNRKLVEKQSKFENFILKQMENLECIIHKLKKDFVQLNSELQIEEKHDDLQSSKIKNSTMYFDRHLNQVSNEKRAELKNIVAVAVENLRRELENKRKSVMRDNEEKIRKLIFEIHSISNNSAHELKQLCDYTASDLTKNLVSVLNTDNGEVNSDNKVQHQNMENMDSSYCSSENHECFNYENICKVLSEHLQLTQYQKDALEQDNLDITLKYGDTKEALESQASLISLLQNEITALKDHVYKKSN